MSPHRKNTALADVLRTHPEAGLPLFADEKLTERQRDVAANAPRAIELATETRKAAHERLVTDHRAMGRKQSLVFDALTKLCSEHHDATNEEIARALGWEINRVVGRTFELRQLKRVKLSRKRTCRITGQTVSAWRCV